MERLRDHDQVSPSLVSPSFAYFFSVLIIILCLVGDLAIPRGATAAIGYSLVPVIAVATRNSKFLIGITTASFVFTWIGCLLEPLGASLWMSVFDRAAVSVILLVTLFIVSGRAKLLTALIKQTQELNDAKRELENSNAELANFASVVAHDLRGPLNTVGMLLHIISRDRAMGADPEKLSRISEARAQVTRMSTMISNLLRYGRMRSGELHLTSVDCAHLLKTVEKSLQAEISNTGTQIAHDPLPTITADDTLIASLFQNLIENSIKYRGDAPPRIHISAVRLADSWQFAVRDNGMGISSNDAQNIFDPFRQGTMSSPKKGVGLGLATCKRIVEKHGGRIRVESEPGRGATFIFTIPDSKELSHQTPPQAGNEI